MRLGDAYRLGDGWVTLRLSGVEVKWESQAHKGGVELGGACLWGGVDGPLLTNLLLFALAIPTSLQNRQDETRHKKLRDKKRYQDAKGHPEGLRAKARVMIREK